MSEDARQSDQRWDRPDHYGGEENPFEPIKIIEHYDLNFNLGNVIKYVLRAGRKLPKHNTRDSVESYEAENAMTLADLRKAQTYIGFEIRRRTK